MQSPTITDKESIHDLLKSALSRLEKNVHLVKCGDPRTQALIAISEIREAIYISRQ